MISDSNPMTAKKGLRAVLDFVGIGLSLLCLVHCLALPVLISFAPAILRGLPGDDVTHRSLAVGIGFVGLLAFHSGYRVHRRRWVLAAFVTGLLLVSSAAILGGAVLTDYGEGAITICGGILLVTAHLFNHSFCRSCAARACGQPCPCAAEPMTSASSTRCLDGSSSNTSVHPDKLVGNVD
jgi:MerC mercury resistance protein